MQIAFSRIWVRVTVSITYDDIDYTTKEMVISRLTKLADFYHSDYCLHLYCYFRNVSADMSSGLLQLNRVQVLSIPVLLLASGQDWTWLSP